MVSMPVAALEPVTPEDFLPAIGLWIQAGGCLLVAMVGIGIGLAATIQMPTVVKAAATVRPVGEVRVIEATTPGVVTQILVQENQTVAAGVAIATLDNSESRTQIAQIQEQILQSEQEMAHVQAQLQALDGQAAAQAQDNQQQTATAQADLSLATRAYQDRKLQAIAAVQEAESQVQAAKSEWEKAQQDLEAIQADLRAHEVSLKSARVKQARYQQAASLGALSQDQLAEVQLTVQQQEQAVASQLATLAAQQRTIANRYQLWQANQAKLHQSQTALNPSQDPLAIAQAKIQQTQAAGAVRMASVQQDRQRLLSQHSSLQHQQARDRQRLAQLQHDQQQHVIKAPITGKVHQLALHNIGQAVQAQDVIAKLVPSSKTLTVKAQVAAQDVSQLQRCTTPEVTACTTGLVWLKIAAYPYPDYGTLKGVVREIAADTTQNHQDATYEVVIQPETLYLQKGTQQYPLMSGMEATAEIVSRTETFLSYFLRKARLILDAA